MQSLSEIRFLELTLTSILFVLLCMRIFAYLSAENFKCIIPAIPDDDID